jgi:hypothetical protein
VSRNSPFPEQSLGENLSVPEDRLAFHPDGISGKNVSEGLEMCCEVLAPCERSLRGALRVEIGRRGFQGVSARAAS